MRRAFRWFVAAGLVLALGVCSGCKGRTSVGVCVEAPGLPGKVCIDVLHEGKKKTLTLPAEVVEEAPDAEAP